MATIKAIQQSSVHQIQSGQVIVDLNSVVKELVENALDAGATSIDVRFKNHGLDSIEVQDNGAGISPEDYETIALKHYTSKLSSYEDLSKLDTFGFRGEALSSLCALSDFHIITAKAGSGAKGTRLDFEVSGKLKGTSVVAAQKGTTICVENLFKNLPVRRKELEKNIKREYGKVLGLLHSYACIGIGVRVAVSNQVQKGKKVFVFSTKGNPTTRENVANVFGTKALVGLVKLDLKLEMQPSVGPTTQSVRNWGTQEDKGSKQVLVQGHISRPIFGEGRQASDRQMFFVNSRPCGLPQVSKAFNEVYKSFNVSQSPFVFANLVMDTNAYDVNVSPDKRTILLHDQTALLESLKNELTQLFESVDQSVPTSQLAPKKLPAFQPLHMSRKPSLISEDSQTSDPGGVAASERTSPSETVESPHNDSPVNLIQQWVGRDADSRQSTPQHRETVHGPSKDKQRLAHAFVRRTFRESDGDEPETVIRDAVAKMGHDGSPITTSTVVDANATELTQHMASSGAIVASVPQSSALDDLFSQRPPPLRREVQDFNARLQSQKAKHIDKRTIINTETVDIGDNEDDDDEDDDDEDDDDENEGHNSERRFDPDTTVETPMPKKTTQSSITNAFDRLRQATTSSDTSIVSKKRKVYNPRDSKSIARFGASPSLARGLQRFAAPGTQTPEDGEDVSDDEDQLFVSKTPRANHEELMTHTQALEEDYESQRSQDSGTIREGPDRDALPATNVLFIESEDSDDEYLDEDDKKIKEDAKIARMIQQAEEAAARPTEESLRRASHLLNGNVSRKNATVKLVQLVETSTRDIERLTSCLANLVPQTDSDRPAEEVIKPDSLNAPDAESKLSLTISKSDFLRMRIVGQFNLGFVLAVRPASENAKSTSSAAGQDHIFIIDQHAADEKYNFERFTQTTTLNPQRLVQPKPLHLTAVEEEIILAHPEALVANGFELVVDDSGYLPMGQRCKLLSLPTSKETTFTLSDLEELIHLLSETVSSGNEIPRPTKVRKMLAMRACRSSIMVGKTLQRAQMDKVVRHMGEMEKPWNCPHGRPTMRHLAGLGHWTGWTENAEWIDNDDEVHGGATDWGAYLASKGS